MHFKFQEGSYIPVSLSIHKNMIFGKNKIGISVQFTTVPKLDSRYQVQGDAGSDLPS